MAAIILLPLFIIVLAAPIFAANRSFKKQPPQSKTTGSRPRKPKHSKTMASLKREPEPSKMADESNPRPRSKLVERHPITFTACIKHAYAYNPIHEIVIYRDPFLPKLPEDAPAYFSEIYGEFDEHGKTIREVKDHILRYLVPRFKATINFYGRTQPNGFVNVLGRLNASFEIEIEAWDWIPYVGTAVRPLGYRNFPSAQFYPPSPLDPKERTGTAESYSRMQGKRPWE